MSRLLLACAASSAALALTAAPVAAQSTNGTIVINGSVAAKCATSPGGGSTFGDTIGLSELADANGALVSTLSGSSAASPAFSRSFSLTCTGSNFGVSVEAFPLSNTDVATAPTGYARSTEFTGRLSVDLVSSSAGASTLNLDDASAVVGASTGSAGAGKFLANTTGNVRVSGYGFTAPAGAILVAGPYQGRIIITVSPT